MVFETLLNMLVSHFGITESHCSRASASDTSQYARCSFTMKRMTFSTRDSSAGACDVTTEGAT